MDKSDWITLPIITAICCLCFFLGYLTMKVKYSEPLNESALRRISILEMKQAQSKALKYQVGQATIYTYTDGGRVTIEPNE
jgi:hypothetical protein